LGIGLVEGIKALIITAEAGGLTIPPPPDSIKDWPLIGQPLYDYWILASSNIRSALTNILPQLRPVGETFIEMASSAGLGSLKFLISVIIMGFLFMRGPAAVAATRAFAYRIDSFHGEAFVKLAGATIRAVSRGVIGISLLQAVIAGIGMSVAGVPYASVLTLVILMLGIVQVGPLLVAVPLVIWGWISMSTAPALAFTGCMVAVYLVEVFLKPFVLARGLSTPMLIIFIGVIGGILAHGIPGLFAGPIVLAVAWELMNAWIYREEPSSRRSLHD
jgi:predicted PurR-regulated permease PerM